jgi:hypothetical protein
MLSKKNIFILLLAIIISWFGFLTMKDGEKALVPENRVVNEKLDVAPAPVIIESENDDQPEKKEPVIQKVPDKILIDVPFTSQAPYSKWDAYHEEACEEASLIMVRYFLEKKALNPEIAENEIQKLIRFEIDRYGDYMDSDARGVVTLAKDYYGLNNLEVVYDFTKEELKKELAKGNPIIIPAAGRLLGNPNFTAPGPLYHNLVLIGYEGSQFITNDPGTRKGKGYRYDADVFYAAIHDYPGDKNNIIQGRKAMIVIRGL